MMQSTSYASTGDDHRVLGDAFDALAVGIDQIRAGLVVRVEILVVEAGPLAELVVPSLQFCAVFGSRTTVSTRARISSSFEVRVFEGGHHSFGRELIGAAAKKIFAWMRRDRSVHPSITRSSSPSRPVCGR